ncbi:MAG: M20/M25/M40 family metallo-hydrolase [Anaerolineaceae bacterium]|nr:M20/M25/M40 family metallo-hydrolase [Anaerolineaceae bacterium]
MKPFPDHFIKNILDLTCTIQAIPAPTFNESLRAAFFLKQFTNQGLADVQMDEIGNILGRLPGSENARPLVVCAHMDTVHPLETQLGLRKFDDRIIGPGIGDNAMGLAAIIGLIRSLRMRSEKLPGDLWLVINVGEEGLGDLRGIQAIVDRFENKPLAYLIIEGMGLGTILNRGLGVERYRIEVYTPGGHSWVDYGQPSAIHELCAIVTRLAALQLPRTPCTTLNAGIIHGGTSINTIAAEAWIELDLRSEDGSALAKLTSEVEAIVKTAQCPGVQVEMKRIGKRLAGQLADTHSLVRVASSVLADLGIEARLDIASTDANLPLSRGYPAICIGITSGNNAHTMEEYILTSPIKRGLMQLHQFVVRAWQEIS